MRRTAGLVDNCADLPRRAPRCAALSLFAIATALINSPARAQAQANEAEPEATIVVTAQRLPGSVESEIPPNLVLDEQGVASLGATNVTDLIGSLGAQTRTGRGRGGGSPVVLLNGRRVSGFQEMRDLPTEAIKRVEVFPEEVALRFGYAADQRVVNIILKDGFDALTPELEIGGPTRGGRTTGQVELGWLKISKKGRTNVHGEYGKGGSILESERGIIPNGADLTRYRTLLAANETLKLNTVITRSLSDRTGATFNLTLDRAKQASLFGAVTRADGSLGPLARDRLTTNGAVGVTLDGNFGRWRWTGTVRLNADWSRTLTDQATGTGHDLAKSRLTTATTSWTLSGPLTRLPAGPLSVSATAGFDRLDFSSQTIRALTATSATLGRSVENARASVDIPIASRRTGALAAIGNLSVNLNGGYQHLTDFGGLASFGYGVTWSPVEGLTLTGSMAGTQAAPSLLQLRDPALVSPGVTVFDFVRGETAIVTQTSGGNPVLRAEKQRDLKIGASLDIKRVEGLSFSATWYRNRSTNPLSTFPAITPATEAAFPGRITRDASGRLTAIDVRAINFQSDHSEELRWGLTFTRGSGGPPGMGGRGGAGRGGGRGMGFGPMAGGKRLTLSLFDTIKFADTVRIAPGVAGLDLLHGDATGSLGGTPRHKIEIEGGAFNNGIGLRFNGAWDSGSTVHNGLTPDLRFGDIMTLNLRLFINFDQRKAAVKSTPFLKGSRLMLRIDNVTDAIRHVSDANGAVPLRYQPGDLDPLGRLVEVSFRKAF
ncbi:MAG: hypothetical protein RL367_1556 [Pseudomonadota bacterium]